MSDPAKEITKYIWSLGNYEEVARTTMPVAAGLVEAAGVRSGHRVLDVATGNGNVAIIAARLGAEVTGCDLTPAMLELARARTQAEGVAIGLDEADVEALPYADGSFDHVLSTFGTMFAPHVDVAISEMFRVMVPGGTIGMSNWSPTGLLGRQTTIMRNYAPGGAPDPDPLLWGVEDRARERIGPHAGDLHIVERSVRERYASWTDVVRHYEHNLGPSIALKQVLAPERYDEMMREIRDLYDSENLATDQGYEVDLPFLQIVATKPN